MTHQISVAIKKHPEMLVLWLGALISYFAPWIHRRPMSAALAWNAHQLFDLLRLLPAVETGAVTVNLQALRLPLLGLALLLPALLARHRGALRWAAGFVGCALAAMTLPPYPEILGAWRTPGWRVPFWWAVGTMAGALATPWFAPRLGRYLAWWILCVIELAMVPAIITLYRLLPPLTDLHGTPVRPGWGFWGFSLSAGAIALLTWYHLVRTRSNPATRV